MINPMIVMAILIGRVSAGWGRFAENPMAFADW
jgi:hypothetical protein